MPNRSKEREQFLADVVICAVEGGTGYWTQARGYNWSDELPVDTQVTLHEWNDDLDDYDPQGRLVNIDTIAHGIVQIATRRCPIRETYRSQILNGSAANDATDIDADLADYIVQAALFGQLVYG